jgi:hypothetical protein
MSPRQNWPEEAGKQADDRNRQRTPGKDLPDDKREPRPETEAFSCGCDVGTKDE